MIIVLYHSSRSLASLWIRVCVDFKVLNERVCLWPRLNMNQSLRRSAPPVGSARVLLPPGSEPGQGLLKVCGMGKEWMEKQCINI
jgi:hypothetical protein